MITSLVLKDTATFRGPAMTLSPLKAINYFFGANGVGKTTISRVLHCLSDHAGCSIAWAKGRELETRVYNRDFVDRNFRGDVKGVFTLGQESVELKQKISEKSDQIRKLTTELTQLKLTVEGEDGFGGKVGELGRLREAFAETCFTMKRKYDDQLSMAFEGVRGNKDRFRDRLIQEAAAGKGDVIAIGDIIDLAATVFANEAAPEIQLTPLDPASIIEMQANPLLRKAIVGSDKVDIAQLINALGASDWVRTGRDYLATSAPRCPFCQQKVGDDLASKLSDFFDSTYAADCVRLKQLAEDYRRACELLERAAEAHLEKPSHRIDVQGYRAHLETLRTLLGSNQQKLQQKVDQPSLSVQLQDAKPIADKINENIAAANAGVREHNTRLANLTKERARLKTAVWRHLWDVELKAPLTAFQRQADALQKAITSLRAQIKEKNELQLAARAELAVLEQQTTSVAPTMAAINRLLLAFGFTSFSLRQGVDPTTYQLVRRDGSLATDTISDGERTFLTFIYFYHWVSGSHASSGTIADRVIVIDDPVSSLDSDVLFVVSNMVKDLVELVRKGSGQLAQLFVMTHNVYFHKEVTFDPASKGPRNDETFWVVRKAGDFSRVDWHESNPVKSSYELLWQDVRSTAPPPHTICNTLRRILENYFKLLGNVDPKKFHDKFDGEEKVICRSLLSWINDGSHFGMEDLHLSQQSPEVVEKYLAVFKRIFETQGQKPHYDMMMSA